MKLKTDCKLKVIDSTLKHFLQKHNLFGNKSNFVVNIVNVIWALMTVYKKKMYLIYKLEVR